MCVSGKDRRFILTGDGSLIDNLGTSTGSRTVQSYKGRAQISVWFNGGHSVLSVASTDCPRSSCTFKEEAYCE